MLFPVPADEGVAAERGDDEFTSRRSTMGAGLDNEEVAIGKSDVWHGAGDAEHDFSGADFVSGNDDTLVGLDHRHALGDDAGPLDDR